MKKQTENRWWEFYFVRYLVGTVIGFLVMVYIFYNPDSVFRAMISTFVDADGFEISMFTGSHFMFFAFLGFAFCYISSAPILVFHTGRAYLVRSISSGKRLKKMTYVVLFVIAVLSVSYFFTETEEDFALKYLGACVVWSVIFLQLALLMIAGVNRMEILSSYYKEISDNRSSCNGDGKVDQYVESYRHLREHGNAFFIIFLEFILAAGFSVADTAYEILALIVFWISPSVAVWYVATHLESKLKDINIK